MKIKDIQKNKGYSIVYLLVIIFIFSTMLLPLINLLALKMQVIRSTINKEEALQIANAGINYYQWRLAHFPNDYQDGTGEAGPYIHDYTDLDTQTLVGQFSLNIIPPEAGSTIVTIESTGWSNKNPSAKRKITARYGIPSLAKYAFLSDSPIWIGNSESVSGEMQINNGIRFDGTANAPIQSTRETYECTPDLGVGCDATTTKPGIWGSASSSVQSFWRFPVSAVDFSSLTADLASIKSQAESGGIYLPPSGTKGYSLVFSTSTGSGTVTIYKINTSGLISEPTGYDINGIAHDEDIDYSATGRTLQSPANRPIPSNGIIYVEDNVWVEGGVKGRVMVAAAKLNDSVNPTIYIPKNIVYDAKDGSNVLGLIAEKDVVVTYRAPTNLEINAALVAQTGSVQFFYYPSGTYRLKNSIIVYGSIMTYGQWTWSYVDDDDNLLSGFANTSSIYDSNLLFGPPPSFPLSASGYQQMDWKSN